MGADLSYNKYPEGTECRYRVTEMNKLMGKMTVSFGILDAMYLSRANNLGGLLVALPKYVVPGALIATSFSLTRCTMMSEKYTYWQSTFTSGMVSGLTYCAYRRSFFLTVPAVVTGLVFSWMLGIGERHQKTAWFHTSPMQSGIETGKYNFSQIKDRGPYT